MTRPIRTRRPLSHQNHFVASRTFSFRHVDPLAPRGPLYRAFARGARTGLPRRNVVIYFHDGDVVTIIASKLGAPGNPSWFHNALANPEVTFGGQPFTAELVEDEGQRTRLWALADRVFPPFEAYRERAASAGRTIPILQLVARSPSVSPGIQGVG